MKNEFKFCFRLRKPQDPTECKFAGDAAKIDTPSKVSNFM